MLPGCSCSWKKPLRSPPTTTSGASCDAPLLGGGFGLGKLTAFAAPFADAAPFEPGAVGLGRATPCCDAEPVFVGGFDGMGNGRCRPCAAVEKPPRIVG